MGIDVKTLCDILRRKVRAFQGNRSIDDRTMLMERVIQLVSGLPDGSRKREQLTSRFINELWCSLEHPPTTYVGDNFKYRTADGSFNVIPSPS